MIFLTLLFQPMIKMRMMRENQTKDLVSQSSKNVNDTVQFHPSVPIKNDVYDIMQVKSNESIRKSASSLKQPSELEISTQIKEYSRNELDSADSSKSDKQSKGFTNSYVEAKQREHNLLEKRFDFEKVNILIYIHIYI